jgi:hypothetical protein
VFIALHESARDLILRQSGTPTNLQLHAKHNREFADLQTLRSPLRGVTTFLAVVSSIGMEIFSGSEAVQAAEEGPRSRRRSRATEFALLLLKLDIKAEIGHGVVGVGGLATFVAHDAAAQFAVEHLMEEALTWLVVAVHVSGGR